MLPIPTVLAMLASMATLHQLTLAQAVSTATASGLLAGGLAGAATGVAAGVAATNPNLFGKILTAPLRLANAPFYYLLGGAARDREIRSLQLTNQTNAEAQRAFIEGLKEKKLVFDGLQVNLSEDYVGKIEAGLSAGGGAIPVNNPSTPSLFSIGSFEDPFKETYTIIMLNETGKQIIIGVLVIVAGISFVVLFLYVFRRLARYSLKGSKVIKKIITEEQIKENQQDVGLGTNSLNTNGFPVILSK